MIHAMPKFDSGDVERRPQFESNVRIRISGRHHADYFEGFPVELKLVANDGRIRPKSSHPKTMAQHCDPGVGQLLFSGEVPAKTRGDSKRQRHVKR